MSLAYPKPDRRTGNPQTDGQRIASEENFAIFVLKGIQSQVSNPRAAKTISKSTVDVIKMLADREINAIKLVQEMRKDGKK